MSDSRSRKLECLSRLRGTDIRRLSRLLEARRAQRHQRAFERCFGRGLGRILRWLNKNRTASSRALSRTDYHRLLEQLSARGSSARRELAYFVKLLRNNRGTARCAQALVRANLGSRIATALGGTVRGLRAQCRY